MLTEAIYQTKLVKKLHDLFPGCYIFKNDPAEMQGIPDILILFGFQWAMLEVKLSERSSIQPNQQYYVDTFNHMSFAAFIYPENEGEILAQLQDVLGDRNV